MLKILRESAIEHPWRYRAIMGLIAVAFVLTMGWGIDTALTEKEKDFIISVGEDRVSRDEYQRALQLRAKIYRIYKEKGLMPEDIPEDQLKQQIVEGLIDRRLWLQAAREMGVIVTSSELRDSILNDPNFQSNGKFDPELYKAALRNFFLMTPEMYESARRADLIGEKAQMLVRESVAPTADELSEVRAMLGAQPTPTVPMQAAPAPDRAYQAVLMQKQQRAVMAYQEALKAKTKISVHRELL